MQGMNTGKISDAEFKDLWAKSGGSAAAVAKIAGLNVRGVFERRRRIERRDGISLLCTTDPRSTDYGASALTPEFPDWRDLEIKNGLLVAFSDSHLIPHRKSVAHRALCKLIQELQPTALVEMGDLLDFASISRHHRIGWDKQLTVKEEVSWAQDVMEELDELMPKRSKKLRTRGNHDQRFAGHIANNLASYEGIKGLSLEDHLPDWPLSWAVRVNDDELFIAHRNKGGLHGPFNNTLWAGVSYATGHQHQQKVYPLTDLRHTIKGTPGDRDRWGVDVGCLAEIYSPHFRFMEGKPRNYRSGFAAFRFVDYRLRHPLLMRVIDEKLGLCEYNGKDFSV